MSKSKADKRRARAKKKAKRNRMLRNKTIKRVASGPWTYRL
jgi:hypothetical protein